MYFSTKFASLAMAFTLLAASTRAKPVSDQIVFRDDEDSEVPAVGLYDENQLLPIDQTKLLADSGEVVDEHFEHGSFFQGDIVLVQDQKDYLLSNTTGNTPTRTGWIDESYRWPKDKLGYVSLPYEISSKAGYSDYQKNLLRLAMDDIETYTCVRFVKRTTEEDYVFVVSGSGCSSHLGKIDGMQELSLQKNGCFSRGTIIHEFIHALGYDHMHSHAERNKFIDIKWNNIQKDAISNFDRVDPRKFSNFGTTYDLYSVMHYDSTAFSKNGEKTIIPRNLRYRNIMGQRNGMSRGDQQRINNMYKCTGFPL